MPTTSRNEPTARNMSPNAIHYSTMKACISVLHPRGIVGLTLWLVLGVLTLYQSSNTVHEAASWNHNKIQLESATGTIRGEGGTPPPQKTTSVVYRTPPPKTTPVVRTLSAVLRTWHQDASMALIGLSSVVKQIDNQLLEIVVVTDEESATVVQTNLIEPLAAMFPDLYQRKGIQLRVEPMLLRNGHIQQKYSKMTADMYTQGDFILHVDSDCVVTQWHDACFLEDGKPVNDYATFESLIPPSGLGVLIWKQGTEVFLGIPDEIYEFSRLNQHVYPRELYSVMRKRAKEVHGVPFLDIFHKLNVVGTYDDKISNGQNTTLVVSDFNVLGATSFHFAPQLMTQKHLDGHTPWRPICIAQCNARVLGAECCEKFLKNQTLLAQSGKATSAHVDCKHDFPLEDPCYCGNKSGMQQ